MLPVHTTAHLGLGPWMHITAVIGMTTRQHTTVHLGDKDLKCFSAKMYFYIDIITSKYWSLEDIPIIFFMVAILKTK